MKMPALFVGHGSPMNAIVRNEFHLGWEELARRLPRPDAVLCISAHWETRGVRVTAGENPGTIHDFRGFPKALYDVQYQAPGEPRLAGRVAEILSTQGIQLDPVRGLDHGAWSVLIAMYPTADVPVVQLSLDTSQPGSFHYGIARQLAPLRDEGVLIVGSGNIVHNLRLFDFNDPEPLPWALAFDTEVRRLTLAGGHEVLMDYGALGPHARLAVPTPEHFLPLLYALAQQQPGDTAGFYNSRVLSAISMTCVLIGGQL